MQCGLLGKKLGHSYSPQIHSHLGPYRYSLFEKAPDELEDFLRNGDFTGLNVTIPYKKDVIAYCDELSERAQKLGAVNTIVRREDGSLIGHNTDYFGFHSMLARSGLDVAGKKVLVLGSGGASATAVCVLKELNSNVVVISRNGEDHYGNLHKHADAYAIVNATPVGMYPNVGVSALDLDVFPSLQGVLDIVYNPARTQLLLDAEKRGLITDNGLWMLVAQAKESAEWFQGKPIDDKCIPMIHGILRRQKENIVLIGMPGCGKSTIGSSIAKRLGKKFVDADTAIEVKAGCSIPEIFGRYGEEGFRQIESEVLAQLGKESGLVIATGGGCVMREVNYLPLHQNGTLYWIKRDIDLLPTDGRPLSQKGKLTQMYAIRRDKYAAFADHVVLNDCDISDAVAQILTLEGYQ